MEQAIFLACFAALVFTIATLVFSDNFGRGYLFDKARLTGAEISLLLFAAVSITGVLLSRFWVPALASESIATLAACFFGVGAASAALGWGLGSMIASGRHKAQDVSTRFKVMA